jgi:hypothetical protein
MSKVADSIALSAEAPNVMVGPGEQKLFYLNDTSAPALTQVLADDVKDEAIAVLIHSDTSLSWKATGDELPRVVREVATSVIQTEDD